MVEAANTHLHPTSILVLEVYKVFEHLEMQWMSIGLVHPYADTSGGERWVLG